LTKRSDLQDCDYTIMIAVVCRVFQTYNFGETHLSAKVMSAFVFVLGTNASACLNFRWQCSSQEGPRRFWLHCHDGCDNFCFPCGCHCLLNSNSMVVTWCAL